MGADEAAYNAELFGNTLTHEQTVVDTSEAAVAAAQKVTATSDVLVTHVPDPDALRAIVDTARANNTLVLNAGARADVLRGEACDPYLFHVIASDAQYADALIAWMVNTAGIGRVAVVRDESAAAPSHGGYAMEQLAAAGVEATDPVPVETAAAQPPAAADALWLDLRGDAQRAALTRLADAPFPILCPHLSREAMGRTTGPVLWHPALFKYGASEVSTRFAERAGQPIDELAYAHWAAMQTVANAILAVNGSDAAPLREHLRTQTRFDGRKAAPLTFRAWNQQMRHELYIVEPSAEGTVVGASVPASMPEASTARRTALDTLGHSAETSSCTL